MFDTYCKINKKKYNRSQELREIGGYELIKIIQTTLDKKGITIVKHLKEDCLDNIQLLFKFKKDIILLENKRSEF